MTGVAGALYRFFSGFGLPIYAEGSVPQRARTPYITVRLIRPDWQATVDFTARLWYRDDSFEAIDAKVDAIAEAIGAGACVPMERGAVWVYKDDVFAQYIPFDGDVTLKCVYLRMKLQIVGE